MMFRFILFHRTSPRLYCFYFMSSLFIIYIWTKTAFKAHVSCCSPEKFKIPPHTRHTFVWRIGTFTNSLTFSISFPFSFSNCRFLVRAFDAFGYQETFILDVLQSMIRFRSFSVPLYGRTNATELRKHVMLSYPGLYKHWPTTAAGPSATIFTLFSDKRNYFDSFLTNGRPDASTTVPPRA